MSVLIHSVRLIDGAAPDGAAPDGAAPDGAVPDGAVPDAWVRFAEGQVAAAGTGDSWRAEPDSRTVIDGAAVAGPGALLTPGFIDIHGHGGGGASYDDGPEAIRTARALHRGRGTTRAVISLVTAPVETMRSRAAMVADLMRTEPEILGSHLEGPFLEAAHRGAHEESLLRPPEPAVVESLLDAGRGSIRQITFAPELIGGLAAIRATVRAGAAAAVGHTGADHAATQAAFDAGATILTHAFNAMPGMHHRDPGPVAAAASDPRVTLEVIADGVHLHPDIIRTAFAIASGRIALVTDAMAAAGRPDGDYRLGARHVQVRDRVARVVEGAPKGQGAIAGSTVTQDAALRTAVAAGVGLVDAIAALTTVPARAIGVQDAYGTLSIGRTADAVLLTHDLEVRSVWVAGVPVAPAAPVE